MSKPNWHDLRSRTVSALVLAAVFFAALWAGGAAFQALVALAVGVVSWELWLIIAAQKEAQDAPAEHHPKAALAALAAASATAALGAAPMGPSLALIALVPLAGLIALPRYKIAFAGFSLAVQGAGIGLVSARIEGGAPEILWLVLVVIATDVAGYFAGRLIGGRKFWPSISPKKTWAGVLAGWAAAALVSLPFIAALPAGAALPLLAVALSFASQLGDIAQSALKRRVGVKDSSNLIPGHGGAFDRLDAMLGAALALFLAAGLFG